MCVPSFIAEDVDVVGDRGSGYAVTVDIQTLLEAFLNMSLRSACFFVSYILHNPMLYEAINSSIFAT
jgi:hypothetical protein